MTPKLEPEVLARATRDPGMLDALAPPEKRHDHLCRCRQCKPPLPEESQWPEALALAILIIASLAGVIWEIRNG